MVQSCCAYGCSNRSGQNKGLKVYSFPKRPAERIKRWIAAVKRDNWQPNEHSRVCSAHFVTGLFLLKQTKSVTSLVSVHSVSVTKSNSHSVVKSSHPCTQENIVNYLQ